jgi:hypothetical protein
MRSSTKARVKSSTIESFDCARDGNYSQFLGRNRDLYDIPCIPTPVDTEEEEAPQPAFGNLTTCDEVRSSGFIILVDVFAAVLIASELEKHIANSTKHNLFYHSIISFFNSVALGG